MKRFEVYEMALQMIRALRPAVERIRQRDRDLAAQLKRAGSSVPGNIAEGARRVGQDPAAPLPNRGWLCRGNPFPPGGRPGLG